MTESAISKGFVEREFASIAQEYQLGIPRLKNEQIDIIISVLQKKDTIGILPTGFGKSVTFYVLPFLKARVIILFKTLFLRLYF